MPKTPTALAAIVGLTALSYSAFAQSPDLAAQRGIKIEKCFSKLAEAAAKNPDLSLIPDIVSVPLGLGKSYPTRQASFEDAHGQHSIAVSSSTPDKLLFTYVGDRSARVFVTSRTGDIISGGSLAGGVFTLGNDRGFKMLGEAQVRMFLTHAYPSGDCTAAYIPRDSR